MAIADAILMELDREIQATRRMFERIPEDKLAWRPHPKSYTLGQLTAHMGRTMSTLAAAAEKDTYEFQMNPQPELKTRAEILKALDEGAEAVRRSISKLDDAKMMSLWTGMAGGKQVMQVPRIGFIRAAVLNHHYHHRGQLSVYLRELDVPLPIVYGPTADENPFM